MRAIRIRSIFLFTEFMKIRYVFALLSIFFLTVNEVFSQQFVTRKRYFSVGATLNTMNYVGDLDPGPTRVSPSLRFTRWNIGATGLYRYSPNLSFRGTLSYGRIKGDDRVSSKATGDDIFRHTRNLSFRNNILEVKADIVWDFFQNRGTFRKRPQYVPYAFLGIAYFYHNPKAKLGDQWIALQPLKTEGKSYSRSQFAIPFGVGFRYKLAEQWDLAFEIGWRFTFTDYLDDVSGEYLRPEEYTSEQQRLLADRTWEWLIDIENAPDEIRNKVVVDQYGEPYINGYGSRSIDGRRDKRGSSGDSDGLDESLNRRDLYIVSGFHLTYIIKGGVRCPKFR